MRLATSLCKIVKIIFAIKILVDTAVQFNFSSSVFELFRHMCLPTIETLASKSIYSHDQTI